MKKQPLDYIKDVKKTHELIKSVGAKKIYINKETGKKRVLTVNTLPSMTDGSHKKACDAKEIVQKFKKTGMISHVAQKQGVYADVSDIQDLHESMILVQNAKDEFAQLPAKIRKKFDNDMKKYYEFLQDPANDKEAVDLGLKVWSPEAEKIIKAQEATNGVSKKDSSTVDTNSESDKSSS